MDLLLIVAGPVAVVAAVATNLWVAWNRQEMLYW